MYARFLWIRQKQDLLDNGHFMVWGKPTPWAPQMEYGSLEPAARRRLTDEEIRWNKALIQAESKQQRRGPASAATAATPAAATAQIPEQLHDLERIQRFAHLVNNSAIADFARLAEAEEEAKKQALMQASLEAYQKTPLGYWSLSTSPFTAVACINFFLEDLEAYIASMWPLVQSYDACSLHCPPHPRCNSGSH